MIKKLSKYGNSLALLIDKPILDLLKITETTSLEIKTDGSRLIIEPILVEQQDREILVEQQDSDDEKFRKIHEKIVKKYAPALKKLSEN